MQIGNNSETLQGVGNSLTKTPAGKRGNSTYMFMRKLTFKFMVILSKR